MTEGPKQADPNQPPPATSKVGIGCIAILVVLVILAVAIPIIFGASR